MTPTLRRLPRALALSAALALTASACGSDEPSATESTGDAGTDVADTDPETTTAVLGAGADSDSTGSTESTGDEATTTSTTVAPSTTAAPTSTTEPDIDAPEVGTDGPVCAAYESLMLVGFVSVFSGLADPDDPDLLLTAATPALAQAFAVAVASLPDDDVPAELEASTRAASDIFADTAAAVAASGVDPRLVGAFEQLLDGALQGGEVADVGEADLTELLDDEQRVVLAEVGFNFDAAFEGVPEPDEETLLGLCPTLAQYLEFDGGGGPQTDACAGVPSSALMTLFATAQVEPEPYRDDDPSLCSWTEGERELRVSLVTADLVDQTRSGNEESNEILDVPGLGDEAWVAPGLMLGVTSDGTGGRGGFGSDRTTVGVVSGDTGVLVAVHAPGATDVDALAIDLAELIVLGS